jgi:dihydroorotate dehydrogenase (fumarate)
MADMETTWLGLRLASPVVVGASPISHNPESVALAVREGAGAIVMHSLFEEQVVAEQMAAHTFVDAYVDRDAESRSVLEGVFSLDGDPYLRELESLRAKVDVPVVASLNGTTEGGWTRFAKRLESAGASAIELNLYEVVTSCDETSDRVEARQLEVVRAVVSSVAIPVGVKISPHYASVPAFVRALERAGVAGVVVFNRFYQPDVILDTLEVDRRVVLSTPAELPLRLHALAVLSPQVGLSLACSGGVHGGLDAAKAILTGAHVVQMTSALLERGVSHVGTVVRELGAWLDEKGYAKVADARSVLDLRSAPDARAWERLNYARVLGGWSGRRRTDLDD